MPVIVRPTARPPQRLTSVLREAVTTSGIVAYRDDRGDLDTTSRPRGGRPRRTVSLHIERERHLGSDADVHAHTELVDIVGPEQHRPLGTAAPVRGGHARASRRSDVRPGPAAAEPEVR